jgi:hypothetical protein
MQQDDSVLLGDDGQTHVVSVMMGEKAALPETAAAAEGLKAESS